MEMLVDDYEAKNAREVVDEFWWKSWHMPVYSQKKISYVN